MAKRKNKQNYSWIKTILLHSANHQIYHHHYLHQIYQEINCRPAYSHTTHNQSSVTLKLRWIQGFENNLTISSNDCLRKSIILRILASNYSSNIITDFITECQGKKTKILNFRKYINVNVDC